ncbi:hypothetical protein [Streptomyces sp. URMC 123]|uniref:hypothetical protein n=1 Tax=Streptomyces sp. URMC 123 TaxID=3423403 RepID=UPI003F1AAC5E
MPDWAPPTGHTLCRAGVQFDAVRIVGLRGEEVADELVMITDGAAGPIIHEVVGNRCMYFVIPPGASTEHRWPPGIRGLGSETRVSAYVGVPALGGETWPLVWRSVPRRSVPFVDAALLHDTLCRLVGWRPLPFDTP